MARNEYVSFNGLTPLIDPRRSAAPSVMSGRNFYVDADGPKSGFSRELVLASGLGSPEFITSFDVGENQDTFYFTQAGIFQFDIENLQFYPVLTHAFTDTISKWSRAKVGGDYYFVRRGVDLIKYTTNTKSWSFIDTPYNDIFGIARSGGRLVILASGIVGWSAIDDGTNLTVDSTIGVGSQALSIINASGSEDPIAVLEYSSGFIVYTRQGMLRAELTNSSLVFRFRPLSRNHVPIDEFTVILLNEDNHLFLTERGFFISDGTKPQPWKSELGEYFHDIVLPTLNIRVKGSLSLFSDTERDWVILSYSSLNKQGIYDKAFVYYSPIEQWGSFDRAHCGFIDTRFDKTKNVGFDLGYVDDNFNLFRFTSDFFDFTPPVQTLDKDYSIYVNLTEIPARLENDVLVFPTQLLISGFDLSGFTSTGLYDFEKPIFVSHPSFDILQTTNVDTAFTSTNAITFSSAFRLTSTATILGVGKVDKTRSPLDSEITLGLFRKISDPEAEETDILTRITNISVGMLDRIQQDLFLDYQNTVSENFLDYGESLDKPIYIDYGEAFTSGSDFGVELIGTLDGRQPWKFQTKNPKLLTQEGRLWHYSVDSKGLYLQLNISAKQLGESFHLKLIGVDMAYDGSLH